MFAADRHNFALVQQKYLGDEEALLGFVPELLFLRGLVERTDWHNDDPFEQTLRLCHWLERLPESLLETTTTGQFLKIHLSKRITAGGRYTAHQLMVFAALIHDIGKTETYQVLPDNTTRCIGHEAAGARMARAICDRFDLTAAEKDYVVRLVAAHGEPYALYKRIAHLPAPEQTDHLRRFEDEWGDDLLLLLLLAYGDLVTSHLSQRRPEKYAAILAFYQAWLHRLMNPADRHGRGENHEARSGPG